MHKSIVEDIRAFNRFYTDFIGLLNQYLLNSAYSLAEARIIYEIFAAQRIQAWQIMEIMHIDKSYLSRLLKRLEKDGIIEKKKSTEDARGLMIMLSEKGRQVVGYLNRASNEQVEKLLTPLRSEDAEALAFHMKAIMQILSAK